MAQTPTCKKCGKKLKWLPWKNGKPQRPVIPATNKPCDCWKKYGGGDDYFKGRMFDKADKYKKCPYCDGYSHIEDGNEDHERIYHKDKKVHKGNYITGESCWEDEILYYVAEGHWFNNWISVDGKENIKEFAKKHNIKVIRGMYLLE